MIIVMEMLLMFLVALVVMHVEALTRRMSVGSKQSHVSTSLVFDISSKPAMNCFHENFHLGNSIQITLSTYNLESQHLYMRISSPNEQFSEWFESNDIVNYDGNATESGDYEICVTGTVRFGAVRVVLDIIEFDKELVQASIDELTKSYKAEAAVVSHLERISERVQNMFVTSKHRSFTARRDTNLQLENSHYIDMFSTMQTFFMIASAVAQVIIIRKLFYVDAKKIRI